jgi:hypothetical protein
MIEIHNNPSGANAIVWLDGRRDMCVNDEVWRGPGNILVGNVLSNSTCRSEVAVFSNASAMQLLEGVTAWTDGIGDRLPIELTPLLQVPITVWAVYGSSAETLARVESHLLRADALYTTMNCGIQFDAVVNDATANPNAPGLFDRRCDQAGTLRTTIGFTPGRLNAYYIRNPLYPDGITPSRGAWCGGTDLVPSPTADDKNTLLISSQADSEGLAHEIGHSLTLRHTNSNPQIPADNLMFGGGTNRQSITEGQCFRVNVNASSAVNLNGIRVGPTRACPDSTTDAACPALSRDEPND